MQAIATHLINHGCLLHFAFCFVDGTISPHVGLLLGATAAGVLALQGLGEEYAADPWNPANLARLGGKHGNLLRHVGEHVPGLTSPQLQLGSTLTSRPWAVAPQLLYSISYLHTGDAKKWYGH